MNDEKPPAETPAPATPVPPPAPAPVAAPSSPDPKSQTPDPKSPPPPTTASRPPIDYALPSRKGTWIPTPERIKQIGCLLKLIVGFTVLLCMGYFALVALNPKARQWALQGTKAGPGGTPPTGKGPTPFKAVNQILALPAQALGKTDDVVKANNARVGQLDGVIKEEEDKSKGKAGRASRPVVDPFASPAPAVGGTSRPDKSATDGTDTGPQAVASSTILALAERQQSTQPVEPATELPPAPKPAPKPAAPDSPEQMKLPGEIIITHASPTGAPRATAAFFYSIVKLNVSGITQGTAGKPGRALINGRLTYEGDEINRQLGITFSQLDAANKQLVFRDATGATVTRSY